MALHGVGRMVPQATNMKTREKTVFVAQQLHFANNLAGNDPKLRARAMKKLRKYFVARANASFRFSHDDFMRFWKGLFYCMWMSDKPLVQEELAEEISQLVHSFQSTSTAMLFIQSYFDTLAVEWFGIDYHRIEKFQMFVRRFLRQCLVFCKNKQWNSDAIKGLCGVFESSVLSVKHFNECCDFSLITHFVAIFVEELAKVGAGKLSKDLLLEFLKPFINVLVEQDDSRILNEIEESIFNCLIRQSPEAIEYEEKFEAWKRAGFPGESWEQMVFVGKKDEEPDIEVTDLDPRAGKVNVYLPLIAFDAKSVGELLSEYAGKATKFQCRKFIQKIAQKFKELAEGRYPLAINVSKTLKDSKKYTFLNEKIEDAVEDLLEFEAKLEKSSRAMKNKGKRKKKDNGNLRKAKKMKLEKEQNIIKNSENSVLLEQNGTQKSSEKKGQASCVKNKEFGNENNVMSSVKIKKKKKRNISVWSISEIPSVKDKVSEPNEDCEDNKADNILENGINEHKTEFMICTSVVPSEDILKEISKSQESCEDVGNEILPEKVTNQAGDVTELSTCLDENLPLSEMESNNESIGALQMEVDKESTRPDNEIVTSELNNQIFALKSGDNEIRSKETQDDNSHEEIIELEVTTPLRRSKRLSKGFESMASKEEKENVANTSVNDSSISDSTTKTPRIQITAKRRLSKVSLLNGEKNGENKHEEKKDENELLEDNEISPLSRRRFLISSGIIRATSRMSKVPDREVPCTLETNKTPISAGNVAAASSDSGKRFSFVTPRRSPQSPVKHSPGKKASLLSTPSSSKKVNIDLQMNRSQGFLEYRKAVLQSPSVPHDANKKPCKGVLKRPSIGSPINPFYVPPKGIL